MAQPLTDLTLRKLAAAGANRTEIWDSRVPGLGVRVSKAGTKTFILMFRHRGLKRRMTLGRYPTLTLADARDKAIDALRVVTAGSDPILQSQDHDDASFQFATVVDAYVERHCKAHNKASTARESERSLKKHFVARWGKRDIRDIQPTHINEVLDELVEAGTPSEANHALGIIKTLFRWCVDRDLLAISPCQKIRKPAKHNSRSRTLIDAELKKVWRSFNTEGYPFGDMGKLLLLTAQRRGEVVDMRWSQLDLERKTWTIPASLSKNGREHTLPLSEAAMAVITNVPRISDDRMFPARGNGVNAISGFTRAKQRFDDVSGVAEWTLHDLRRTVATGMAQLGIAPHVIERVLNHVSGTFAGVAGVYNRFEYLGEMRAALDRWAEHVSNVTTDAG